MLRTTAVVGDNPVEATITTNATFQINSTGLYVSVVTLSINDNIKFLRNIKQVFRRKISWNKYRSKVTTQPKSNKLGYMIDPTFTNVNRLFVLSFRNGDDYSIRNSFDEYYMPLVEIKNFNALINNKLFSDYQLKTNKKRMKKTVEISRNNNYTTGTLLDHSYHPNYCKLISIDL